MAMGKLGTVIVVSLKSAVRLLGSRLYLVVIVKQQWIVRHDKTYTCGAQTRLDFPGNSNRKGFANLMPTPRPIVWCISLPLEDRQWLLSCIDVLRLHGI
jgi:hypothetical protein